MDKKEVIIKDEIIDRITVCNQILAKIASLDRMFFKHKDNVASVLEKDGVLFMINQYSLNEMDIESTGIYPPYGFIGGHTNWCLIRDMIQYIRTGEKTNGNHGNGGLYCTHWGYTHTSMLEIQTMARELNYL